MGTAEKTFKRFTVTAALPYANGPLHLGHLAGAYLPPDIYVRYLRARGRDVAFICGTDEHGAAINIAARKDGISPQEVVDKNYAVIKKAFEDIGISFDIFSRTSKEIHHETAREFFRKFHAEGKFVEKTTEQLFDPEAQLFLADRFVTGTCPKCAHPNAYGDQCENCGSSLNPTDLINPKSTISGATPEMRQTTHWYLPLDQYQERLEKYILEDHDYWKKNVYGQCKSWLNDKLQPRAITRDLDWGVKVPVEGAEGKVLYVWFDAPIGYISATKEWAEAQGTDWKPWWQDEDTALIHFIGKDNIVFHCIIFPAILMGHGEYILPENVPANEFLNLEGDKLSTSRNWAVWAHEFVEDFPDKIDVLRYVLASIMPENQDSDFSWKDFQARNNGELADILGNLVRRVTVLTNKYYEGEVPAVELTDEQKSILEAARDSFREVGTQIEAFRFRDALKAAMNIARIGNKYLADEEPWKKIKTDPETVKGIMYTTLQLSGLLSPAFAPFMPGTAEKLAEMFSQETTSWEAALENDLLPAGHKIAKTGAVLFGKIDDEVIEQQVEKLKANSQQNQPEINVPEFKDQTSFDKFQEMDLRVVTISAAEQHPNADRLLKLTVETGRDTRTVVSGVAEHFKPEELMGKQALLLANLAPRKIRGIVSEGMLLFAEDPDGSLHLVAPPAELPNGSTVA